MGCGGGRCVGRQLARPQGPVISCHLRGCSLADRSQETDTTFRRRKRREKTPLVPSSYLSRAHSKTEDSGFPSKNFPDSKSGLSFIHGAIKTYIYKCICRQWYLISYLKFFEAQIVILRGGSHHSTETFRSSLKFSAIQMCMFFHLWGA